MTRTVNYHGSKEWQAKTNKTMKRVKLIPTCTGFIVDGFLKYAPAYKIGEDDNTPKPIIQGEKYVYFDTPEEALQYIKDLEVDTEKFEVIKQNK